MGASECRYARDQPSEIAAIGESAGANLAALLGTGSPESGVGRCLGRGRGGCGVFHAGRSAALQTGKPAGGAAAAQFLGGSPEQVPANYVAASPIDQVSPGDPPMFLVHGIEDP